ncbi:MAG: SIMPL domain-containing protein [Cyanobacteria bacterium P01_A01_bin.135]
MRPVPAQDNPGRILSVTGQGSESAPTSATRVSLGVEVNAETAEAAQAQAAERSSRVVEMLQAEQVEALQTTGITLNPRYDYNNNQRRLVGYTATNTVSFEVATAEAGTLLDELVRSGATNINGISFIASDEAIATAQQQALQEAVEDARAQAAAVLAPLGFEIQEIAGIQVNGAQMPPPMPLRMERAEAFAASDVSTPVVGQEQEVNVSVTLQIRY